MSKLDNGCNFFLTAILTGACILAIWNEKLMVAWCSNTVLWAYLLWEMFGTLNRKIDKLIEDNEKLKNDESK